MTDIEKIIKGLRCIKGDYIPCATCKYADVDGCGRGDRCKRECASDAIALLKEQEAVEPILKREGRNKYYNYYVCPRCNEEVVYDQNYCSECGAKFIWEGR